jgi:hypothetical protein
VERHGVGLAIAVNLDVEALGEGVDDRGTHPMETTGCCVRAGAELAAGVQFCEDDLDPAETGLWFDVHGNTAGAVVHLDGIISVEDDADLITVTAERLIHRVVNDLPEAVHESPGIRGTDVHAGPLTDRFEAFENREVPCGVVGTCHETPSRGNEMRQTRLFKDTDAEAPPRSSTLLQPADRTRTAKYPVNVARPYQVHACIDERETSSQPEGAAHMSHITNEQNVELAAPNELSALDRCDSCGAQAYVRVTMSSGQLFFCAPRRRARVATAT